MEDKKAGVCVGVVLLNKEGKVLMGKRPEDSHEQTSPFHEAGTWTLPMTELKHDEEFEQAAMRAAMEEAGIKIDFIRVACVNNDKSEKGHFVTVGIVSDRWNGEPEVRDASKISSWEWFSLEDSPFPIFIPSAKILMNLKKGKFYFSN